MKCYIAIRKKITDNMKQYWKFQKHYFEQKKPDAEESTL